MHPLGCGRAAEVLLVIALLLLLLACVVGYYGIGAVAAQLMLPRLIARATVPAGASYRMSNEEWIATPGMSHYKVATHAQINRDAVKADFRKIVLWWPGALPAILLSAAADREIDKADPAVAKRRELESQNEKKELAAALRKAEEDVERWKKVADALSDKET
jgi:hypothetical protein